MRFVNKLPLLILLVVSFGTIARADTLQITGTFALMPTGIDFGANGPGTGSFNVSVSSGGIFSSLQPGVSTGSATDLNYTPGGGSPLNTPFGPLSPFLTFNANPLLINLNFISLGVFPQSACGSAPAPLQACTPTFGVLGSPLANPLGLSPFNFANNNTGGSSMNFTVKGNVVNGAISTPVTAVFSVTFLVPYQTILTQLSQNGTTGPITYGATITTNPAVPEPTTILLLGTSLAGLAAKLKKRRKK